MDKLSVFVSLITKENDYQREQAASAEEAACRLGINIQVAFADNDAVNQSQQVLKVIQNADQRPNAILVEPVGTGMTQVAIAAATAGISWVVLNREVDYISQLRRHFRIPVCAVSIDQEQVGRIQGKQFGIFLKQGGRILYIEGPSTGVARARTSGMHSTKPANAEVWVLKGNWTGDSAYKVVKSWLGLSTSHQLNIRVIGCQNDEMAIGARRAFEEATNFPGRRDWLSLPFTGCDGVPGTGQEWVHQGLIAATVVTPPTAGVAMELLAQAIHSGTRPPEVTLVPPSSYPAIEELNSVVHRWS